MYRGIMAQVEPMEIEGKKKPISGWIQKIALDYWNIQDPDKIRQIPMAKIKASLLETKEADGMPNALVIDLLQKADQNEDGFIDYDEYMKFAEGASEYSKGRDTFSKLAMTVIPRNERTVEKRTYLQRYSCCPPPLFMILATLAEVGTFLYYMFDMGEVMGVSNPCPTYSPLIYNPYRRFEAWRYVSYALIHSGYMHLVNNLVVQGLLGTALELVHGWWRIGLIYFCGVVFGAMASSISDPGSYLAGASGGVFSVEYAHLGNIILNWSQMEYGWLQLIIILLMSIGDWGFAIWDTFFSENPSPTGHLAHLGGAVAGLTVGIYVLRNFEKRKWEKYCWWIALVIFLILATIGIVLSATLPVPEYFPKNSEESIGQARIDYFRGRN